MTNNDQVKLEEIYMNTLSSHDKKEVKESVSGAIPIVSMASEAGGVIFLAAMFILPVILEKIRMRLTDSQLKEFAKKVVSIVKSDSGKDTLKMKISRAINHVIQKVTGGNVASVQQEVLDSLPSDIENKTDEEVESETRSRLSDLKRRNLSNNSS